jgi:hypothetical protein
LSRTLEDHSAATLLATFLDGINEMVAIGLKLRTRPTRGVDRVAEAQFRQSYEVQREELERWLSINMSEAIRVSCYELAASLTDTSQDSLLDPKTRAVLNGLRKEYLDTLPQAARAEMAAELVEALRVIGESGAYAPAALAALTAAMTERIDGWPAEARESLARALQDAIPVRSGGRGRPPAERRPGVDPRTTTNDPQGATGQPETPRTAALPKESNGAVPTAGAVLDTLFSVGADAGRQWAETVARMAGPPEPPADPEALATRMGALAPQGREAVCKRMRLTLPTWCAACGQGQLKTLGRSAGTGETLAVTCQRMIADEEFAAELRAALPRLARESGACTEPGLRALGPVIERLWDDALGEEITTALTRSTHPRPGTVRRLITEEAPRLAAHLADGPPVTNAPWRETLSRRGIPWPDRLPLPLSRVPADAVLPLWTQEQEDDPAVARTLLDAAAAEAATRPGVGELLVRLLEGRPELAGAYLAPLLAHLAARPDALQERPRLARAVWEAVLAQPAHLAALPERMSELLTPLLPETVPATREWAAAFLRGPAWLRSPLAERLHQNPPPRDAWLEALLAELSRGGIPQVPDPAAAHLAALLTEALGR